MRHTTGLQERRGWLAQSCEVFNDKSIASHSVSDSRAAQQRYLTAAVATSLVTVGLVRFAYTPLLPALIHDSGFSERSLIALSSAGLFGFLLGALFGRSLATRFSAPHVLNAMNLSASLSLIASAFPLSITWFFFWRLIGGISGGAAIVLLAATVLPCVSQERKGIVGGAIFIGAGLGILASGTAVPLLLQRGLRDTWLGLGLTAIALTILVWNRWPITSVAAPKKTNEPGSHGLSSFRRISFLALFSMVSLGLTSVMLFYSSFVTQQLESPTEAAWGWFFYGVGATTGPLLFGWATSRYGGLNALRAVLGGETAATSFLAFNRHPWLIAVVAAVLGMCITGIVPLAQGWLREIFAGDSDSQNRIWSATSVVYAATQAAAGYLFVWLLHFFHRDFRIVFLASASGLAVAWILSIAVFRRTTEPAVQ